MGLGDGVMNSIVVGKGILDGGYLSFVGFEKLVCYLFVGEFYLEIWDGVGDLFLGV